MTKGDVEEQSYLTLYVIYLKWWVPSAWLWLKICCQCVTYLNLDNVLGAGGLSSLETLAKLRCFLVLPENNNNKDNKEIKQQNSLSHSIKLLLKCTTSFCLCVYISLCVCVYLRCKSSCSCSSWFSRVWLEVVESWFWTFCFRSLISSFKQLIVWNQITEES